LRFPFLELPDPSNIARPALAVTLEGLAAAPQLCLVDTGSRSNLFGAWVAEAAGIELERQPEESFVIGGAITKARKARCELSLGDMRFDAPVWFCDPWPFGFHLLGQDGFFRYFRVTISAAEGWLDCEREPVES
jgi:hypothetical protein